MMISATTPYAPPRPAPAVERPPPEVERKPSWAERLRESDAEEATRRATNEAVQRPAPDAPPNRAPLAEAAGKLVDKLI